MIQKCKLSKRELRVLLTMNGKSLPINRIEEKCSIDNWGAQNILKRLMAVGLIDVETWRNGTLFKLSEKGQEIAKSEYEKRKASGNYGAVIGIINGEETFFKNKTTDYIKSILNKYNEGEFLVNEHIDFIIECLRKSELGKDLITEGVVKIRVIQVGRAYTIEVITNSRCVTIPLNRLFGERREYNHDADVRNCFYWALTPREPLPEGFVRFHDNPSYGELITNFLTETGRSFDEIQVIRVDGHRQFADETLKAQWVAYYQKHANVVIITKETMQIIMQQKRHVASMGNENVN